MTVAVVVSNAESGSLSVLALDEGSGALSPLQTVALGGLLMPMALSPDGTRLFAARRSTPFAAVTLAVDRATGRLDRVGEGPLPGSMAYVATDRSGRWLLSASYGDHVVAVSRIGDDGVVQPAGQVRAAGANAHAIVVDASNRFAFSTSLGDGAVCQWRFDTAAGRLAPNDPPRLALRQAAGPRHLVLHPGGRVAYLLNELDATLDVLALDAARGALAHADTFAALPPGATGAPWAADLHLRPDARFLYASDRRSSLLAGFAVSRDGLGLVPIGHWPVPTQPRGFAIAPGGDWLVVAGQAADRVAAYAIDRDAGELSLRSEHPVGSGPNWVVAFALG